MPFDFEVGAEGVDFRIASSHCAIVVKRGGATAAPAAALHRAGDFAIDHDFAAIEDEFFHVSIQWP